MSLSHTRTATSVVCAMTAIAVGVWWRRRHHTTTTTTGNKNIQNNDRSQSQSLRVLAAHNQDMIPPLPEVVRRALSTCRLAYLSTVDSDAMSSHLSLMRFTYLSDKEIIVLTTRKQTKKYEMLQKQKGVALLVHNVKSAETNNVTLSGEDDCYSITLNGECYIESGPEAEACRSAHLDHNPGYSQFIVGEDIAVLCVRVTSARICNINDEVTKWNINEAQ